MKYCRVLPFFFTVLLLLGGCSDDAEPGTTPTVEDTTELDDPGAEDADLVPEVPDSAQGEVIDTTEPDLSVHDTTELDIPVDTGEPASNYHFVGSIVVAAGIHSDDDEDFTVYGTLACLSGCSAEMTNEDGDFNIVSYAGGYR